METEQAPVQGDFPWLDLRFDAQPSDIFEAEDMSHSRLFGAAAPKQLPAHSEGRIQTDLKAGALEEIKKKLGIAGLDLGMSVEDLCVDSKGLAMWPRAGAHAVPSRCRKTVFNNRAKRVAPDSDSEESDVDHAEEGRRRRLQAGK